MNNYQMKSWSRLLALLVVPAVLLLACMAIVSCGSRSKQPTISDNSNSRVALTTTYVPPTTVMSKDSITMEAFHTVMKNHFPNSTDIKSDTVGVATCNMLDAVNGNIQKMIFMIAADPQMSKDAADYGFIIGVSVPAFCPRWQSSIDSLN